MKSVASFSWQELLSVSQGSALSHHRPFDTANIETDTRSLEKGSFFIPLKGANFDGNTYIEKAYEQGAEGAFITSDYSQQHPELKRFPNLIEVPDSLMTYMALGQFHRQRTGVKVIAITGSSGKTTAKEMLFALLNAAAPGKVQKSEKNFNNEVGVPLTLLNIQPETLFLVIEMGMRGLGQINLLTRCAEPDIAIVTNVGPAHIGILGSLEAIARAKCEIFNGLNPEAGIALVNGDDTLLMQHAGKQWNGWLETFSLHDVDNIHTHAEGKVSFDYEEVTFELGLPGSHNVMNALAGIKACQKLGIPLKKICHALSVFEAGGYRWYKISLNQSKNLWAINDAYNANPASMKVALDAFIATPAPGLHKVAVLGSMAELGSHSQKYHTELGSWISSRGGIQGLVLVGEEARWIAQEVSSDTCPVFVASNTNEAAHLLQQHWPQDTLFLLKASRELQLEQLANLLQQEENPHVVS